MNTFLKARKNLSAIREFTEGIFELDEVLKDLGDFDKIKATYVAQIADLEKASDALKAENAKTSKSTSDLMATARREADQIRSEAQQSKDLADNRVKEVDSIIENAKKKANSIVNDGIARAEAAALGAGNDLGRIKGEIKELEIKRSDLKEEIASAQRSLDSTKAALIALKNQIAA